MSLKSLLLEQIIKIEDVEVELFDRVDGDFDGLLVKQLSEARQKLEGIYGVMTE